MLVVVLEKLVTGWHFLSVPSDSVCIWLVELDDLS